MTIVQCCCCSHNKCPVNWSPCHGQCSCEIRYLFYLRGGGGHVNSLCLWGQMKLSVCGIGLLFCLEAKGLYFGVQRPLGLQEPQQPFCVVLEFSNPRKKTEGVLTVHLSVLSPRMCGGAGDGDSWIIQLYKYSCRLQLDGGGFVCIGGGALQLSTGAIHKYLLVWVYLTTVDTICYCPQCKSGGRVVRDLFLL